MKISRRDMLSTMTAGMLALNLRGAHAQYTPPPNIIFILADDLGYGDLGCYGQKTIQTPRIDQLAMEGLRFSDAYAGSTVCAPSRCALMTGLHTGHCHVRGNKRIPLRPEDSTVAETLKQAGYATGLVGKWGLGNEGTTGVPNKQGFDEFFGFLDQGHAHTYYPEFLWRNEKKVSLEGNVEEKRNVAIKRSQYTHDLFAEEALQFVERHQAHPFFLYLALTIPHANNERGRELGDGMEVPDYGIYDKEDWPNPQKGHAAMISRMDKDVGRLMDKLKALGLDDNTIVFFTSDNGPHREGGGDPEFFHSRGGLRGIKRDLYEGGIRVPMIVRWPGKIAAGSQSDFPWAFWDFPATAAQLAQTKQNKNTDGISVAPTLLGQDTQAKRDHLYWEFHERGFKQAVRFDHWKAVRINTDAPIEIYDLSADLGEQNDIAKSKPQIVEKAKQLFKSARTDSEHFKIPPPKRAQRKKK
jgi:arylsulfatase A-like enzyme